MIGGFSLLAISHGDRQQQLKRPAGIMKLQKIEQKHRHISAQRYEITGEQEKQNLA